MSNKEKKTHKLCARVGIAVLVTDEEYNEYKKQIMEGYQEIEHEQAEWFMKNGHADGDCYLSANDYMDDEEQI